MLAVGGGYSEYKSVQDYSGRAIGHITKKYFQTATDGGGNYYLDYWFMSSAGSKISASMHWSRQTTVGYISRLMIRWKSDSTRLIRIAALRCSGVAHRLFGLFHAGMGTCIFNSWVFALFRRVLKFNQICPIKVGSFDRTAPADTRICPISLLYLIAICHDGIITYLFSEIKYLVNR